MEKEEGNKWFCFGSSFIANTNFVCECNNSICIVFYFLLTHHITTPQHSSSKGRSPSTSSMILPQMVSMMVWTKVVLFRSSVLPTVVLAALLCGALAAFLLLEERAEHSNRPQLQNGTWRSGRSSSVREW